MPETPDPDVQGAQQAMSKPKILGPSLIAKRSSTYLDQFPETKIQEETSAVRARPCTHFCNLQMCHLSNDLEIVE